jgi:hypothetical protein
MAALAFVAKAWALAALCSLGVAGLVLRFAWRAIPKHYSCPVCANRESTRNGALRDVIGVVPCSACQAWLLVRLDDGDPWVKDHVSSAHFAEWIAYAGSRFAALEALERKWGSAPAELVRVRSDGTFRDNSAHASSYDRSSLPPPAHQLTSDFANLFGQLLWCVAVLLVVAFLALVVWAAISGIHWAWRNPLF